ncbi:hypothetical protein J6590_098949 [Homalodisca vitripennis]|nr:hypothetical protein J6590_098949 [Homalodisca vitripennis]
MNFKDFSFLRLAGTFMEYRCLDDGWFLRRLVTSELDCPHVLQRVDFRVSCGIRSCDLFARTAATTNYSSNSVILRIQR